MGTDATRKRAVPAGKFTMGSPEGEVGRTAGEGPQHEVAIAQSFAVSKFEVTFDQWDACVADGACPPAADRRCVRHTTARPAGAREFAPRADIVTSLFRCLLLLLVMTLPLVSVVLQMKRSVAGVAVVSSRAAISGDRHTYRAQLANAPTSTQCLRSSNLARTNRWITAKTIAAETPNMSAPFVASSGPSNRHDGVRSTSP